MGKKIFKLLNYIFFISILYTLYGAIRSSVLNLENLNNKLLFLIVLIIIGSTIFAFSEKLFKDCLSRIRHVYNFFILHITPITIILFSVVFILQMIILYYIHTDIGWDVGVIHRGVEDNLMAKDSEWFNLYLSVYPNNNLFFFFMYYVSAFVNKIVPNFGISWYFWQIFNTILLDLGLVIFYFTAKNLFNRRIAFIAFYLALFSLGLSPWILVPYTDIAIFPLVSFIIYTYIKQKKEKSYKRIFLVAGLGILASVAFLLKPTSIIFIIAWIIIEGILWLLKKDKRLPKAIILCLFIFTVFFVGTMKSFNLFLEKQTVIKYQKDLSMPWTHFVMMGLTGDGGYNAEDVQASKSYVTPQKRKEFNKKIIIERIKQKGPTGYLKFLLQKHFNNTNRGDFAWGVEGVAQKPAQEPKNKLQEFLRDSYYQQGIKVKSMRIYMQILWIITLIGILIGTKKVPENHNVLILELSILGAFLFLVLFEGGRSRYLIQFLPMFYLMAAYGLDVKLGKYLRIV